METFRKQKVSLRGASAKEITRDALLEKASLERAIRSEARKAASAAQLIQRVWRGHRAVCKASDGFRAEWDAYVAKEWSVHQPGASIQLLCDRILRPFLYFFGVYQHKITTRESDQERFVTCFTILLQSINSSDSCNNYCSLCTGSKEQQSTWLYQVHRLVRLSCVGLVEGSSWGNPKAVMLASLAVRLLITLTDSSLWRSFNDEESKAQAKLLVQALLEWIAEGNAHLYPAIGICILRSHPSKQEDIGQSLQFEKEKLFVMASAITVAVRPLQRLPAQDDGGGIYQRQMVAKKNASEAFCSFILTIPLITQCLPAAILHALQHPSVLTPCLEALESLKINPMRADIHSEHFRSIGQHICFNTHYGDISPSAWALINIVALARGSIKDGSTKFVKGLALETYLRAVCSLLNQLLPWIENLRMDCEANEKDDMDEFSVHSTGLHKYGEPDEASCHANARRQLIGELEPLCQQWHLKQLLDHTSGKCNLYAEKDNMDLGLEPLYSRSVVLRLPDIALLYSILVTVFTALQGAWIPCPVLNVLAFAPGFLFQLWVWLDDELGLTQSCDEKGLLKTDKILEAGKHLDKGGAPRKDEKLGGSLWASAVSKIKGKGSSSETIESDKALFERKVVEEDSTTNIWDIKKLKSVPGGVAKEALPVLTLFCAAYGHLLMILDDEEFYERQVPFTLKQQRVIAASLNTMVYNGFFCTSKQQFTPLMEAAIKCLNSLYGRDCRRSFCHPSLWLAPAGTNRPPIPAAARAHEVAMASIRIGDFSQAPAIGYVLTMTPHVIPFEERVQIFREFVKSDKMARKMAGEIIGPGPGSIEIAIRRDHLIEDGFAQLNSLGPKLKSGINVSFVNEHGLAEAGLDYGGLFKEFLTDLAKAAFDPGYGLFTQKETEEGFLFPHPAAGNLQHGLPMIEFLGRIVGKAVYEGILLDYSFSHVFLWKLLGRYVFLDELSTLDPELYQSLMYLKHSEGDVKELTLDFTVIEELFGRRRTVELISGGANILVTNENKLQYIHAMADYKLNRQMQPLISAFSRGLSDMIAPAWLSLFNSRELNQLLSGGEHDFDIDDLKANTKYTGGFTENSRTVKQFWEVLREFQPEERCALLKFVTSCSRAPLLGFKHLQPAFTIHKVSCDTTLWVMLGGQDVDRLPSASTCYNTLKLPTYKRMSTLKNKLRYAIHANAGFELS